jgi:hypothetical protein
MKKNCGHIENNVLNHNFLNNTNGKQTNIQGAKSI